ncbi:MAG: rhomboid family intramembrane serine protease [Halodesulfurarchaeum sp.]
MARCDLCGREEGMPYQCRHCGGTFCSQHRLPENHDCPGLEDWNDPGGVFDSGFDDGLEPSSKPGRTGRFAETLPIDTGAGSLFGYFRGNLTYLFLALMWLVFVVQWGIAPLLGISPNSQTWFDLFTVNTTHPLYIWTWFVAVFAHGGFGHIFVNSLVLYFFGPVVERRIGSTRYGVLFFISGILAGLAQVGAAILTNPSVLGEPVYVSGATAVLGASGAIAGLLGVLTILNPNLRIYLYFIIPMPLWVATLLFAGYSVFVSSIGGIGAGGVAQLAHLAGLGIGLAYGTYLKRRGAGAPEQLRLGGGRGGPGMGGSRRF